MIQVLKKGHVIDLKKELHKMSGVQVVQVCMYLCMYIGDLVSSRGGGGIQYCKSGDFNVIHCR